MPDPERLLNTLGRAVQAFRATPGRVGRTVRLDAATEVCVAGDLHGNVDNLRRLLIRADLGRNPGRHLVLQELIHGSACYANGSDKSHQAVDVLAALKCQFPQRVHFLPGNHEMAQLTERIIGKGEAILNKGFREGVDTAYGDWGEAIYQAYLELFAVAPLALRTSNGIFLSHSLPSESALPTFDLERLECDSSTPEDLAPGGSAFALVWGRDTTEEHVRAFLERVDAKLLITGHIPCDEGFEAPNPYQLILDTLGCPAAYALFPTDRPLSHAELLDCVSLL